jgi:3-deoxy-7-phosphoheptulonate synthase
MPPFTTDDLRIHTIAPLATPAEVMADLPATAAALATVRGARRAIQRILSGADDRMVVVIGPCSIHDPGAARDYATRLAKERLRFRRELEIVMRVYFEKPRTTIGWKGLINDPDLDGSFHINKGLRVARSLLRDINALGVPAGTEFLDTISPQYLADLISWGAIGARTTESQVHRELASGLSCPVGFKNGTRGNLKIALDAVQAAAHPHHFLAVTKQGQAAVAATEGNPDCHVILRGGREPNYDAASVANACEAMQGAGMPARLMIDASHANSRKQPENQPSVIDAIARQVAAGNPHVIGVMVESNLVGGRQDLVHGKAATYGQSITDGCLAWEDSIPVLERLAEAVETRREATAERQSEARAAS